MDDFVPWSDADYAADFGDLLAGAVTCQGCGAVRGPTWLGKGHACHRNESGELEEGGTFQ